MGIPSYFTHIVKKYRNIFKNFSKNTTDVDNLYLDCNSIIYDSVNELQKGTTNFKSTIENDKLIITKVCDKLVYYINMIEPSKNVYIAFDGVAPLAKLNQQRKRRYMSWYNNKLIATMKNKVINDDADDDNNNNNNYSWNTSAITPGTMFMKKLGLAIKDVFGDNKNFTSIENNFINNLNIIVSATDEPGEGEHKIYDYIRSNKDYHSTTTTVIYGLDADLIMLTMNHLHISDKMFLFRETPDFIKTIDNTLNPDELYLMDIPTFANSIIQELTNTDTDTNTDSIITLSTETKKNKITDYILICFLLGNDFMPHFPAINIRNNGIEKLIANYKNVISNVKDSLTINNENNGQQIVWKNLRNFINRLSINELDYIKNEYKCRDKQEKNLSYTNKLNPNKKEEDKLLLIPMKDRSIEKYINPFESGWTSRYYSTLFDIRINDDRCKEICINYLEGLEWTIRYYSSGCIDWRWAYNYDYPPLLTDLIKYVPYFDTILLDHKEKNPVSELVQLSYVLPQSSHNLLPSSIVPLLKKEWFNNNCEFKWSFCKYFWESHICLPDIPIHELEEIIQK